MDPKFTVIASDEDGNVFATTEVRASSDVPLDVVAQAAAATLVQAAMEAGESLPEEVHLLVMRQ